MIYRIKQFHWAIQSVFQNTDCEIPNKYLSKSELSLFMKVTKSERNHSIRVCKAALEYIRDENILDIDKCIMCKCALLHDIGKSKARLNIFYKSIIIIINKITYGNFLKYTQSQRINNYYNHPQIGADLLKNINEDNIDIINCIRYHHDDNNAKDNTYLKILKRCDNLN
ncbi:HD domain-containing protein [Clostridium chromiireducens]|uniref:HD domain-containing protein n=1 Tax=Clostridium chromiireducens TaxID=225345 RepID=A0A399IGU4_9CLOT|nr:HD domain-containing protein [Clostridium chromiireducens]RII31961.1 HD domain-containing protein [Clostridium chromiireducens]